MLERYTTHTSSKRKKAVSLLLSASTPLLHSQPNPRIVQQPHQISPPPPGPGTQAPRRRRCRGPRKDAPTRICDSPVSERTLLNGRGAWLLDRTARKKKGEPAGFNRTHRTRSSSGPGAGQNPCSRGPAFGAATPRRRRRQEDATVADPRPLHHRATSAAHVIRPLHSGRGAAPSCPRHGDTRRILSLTASPPLPRGVHAATSCSRPAVWPLTTWLPKASSPSTFSWQGRTQITIPFTALSPPLPLLLRL